MERDHNRPLGADTEIEDEREDGGKRRKEQDAKRKEQLDDALDRALEESFPGSDPVSMVQPPPSAHDKRKR